MCASQAEREGRRVGGAVNVTFGEIEVGDWTELQEKNGAMKPQNGVKVHNVRAPLPHPQTPISLCKYTPADPHPEHPTTSSPQKYRGCFSLKYYRWSKQE